MPPNHLFLVCGFLVHGLAAHPIHAQQELARRVSRPRRSFSFCYPRCIAHIFPSFRTFTGTSLVPTLQARKVATYQLASSFILCLQSWTHRAGLSIVSDIFALHSAGCLGRVQGQACVVLTSVLIPVCVCVCVCTYTLPPIMQARYAAMFRRNHLSNTTCRLIHVSSKVVNNVADYGDP